MFRNIPEMWQYIEKLQKAHDEIVALKKEELNYKCEACKKNPIEIDYKSEDYSTEEYTRTGVKLIINSHYFCKQCYKHIINTQQLPKSQWMKDIDKELFE